MGKRMSISFSDETIKLVNDWRKSQPKIPSFNQAVNDIIINSKEKWWARIE